MSRSFKKHPIIKDNGKSAKKEKALANRKFRRYILDDSIAIISKGNRYKVSVTDPWSIHDCVCRLTEQEAREDYRRWKEEDYSWDKSFFERYPTEDDYINRLWSKDFKRK